MPRVLDYSIRRGAIVRLLPEMYGILASNMKKIARPDDAFRNDQISWTRGIKADLLDINKRWLFVLDERENLTGYMIYSFLAGSEMISLDDIQIDRAAQGDGNTFRMLFGRFILDDAVKKMTGLTARVYKYNEKALKLMEKMGMSPIGEAEKVITLEGTRDDARKWYLKKYPQ